MTDIKELINTTSDGTFLSVVCENPEKSVVGQKLGGPQPPPHPPPRITPLPKSRELLSFHYIQKMPDQVKKVTVSKINETRQSSGGGLWVPSDESCICNMHYKTLKGPVGGKSIWCLGTSNDPMSLTTKDQLREGS